MQARFPRYFGTFGICNFGTSLKHDPVSRSFENHFFVALACIWCDAPPNLIRPCNHISTAADTKNWNFEHALLICQWILVLCLDSTHEGTVVVEQTLDGVLASV
ncbi:hypothetical protein LB505_010540 [Fusarium chuoi]|nr:hypothetical protein LB505_010540 [Fusarium chuoi]